MLVMMRGGRRRDRRKLEVGVLLLGEGLVRRRERVRGVEVWWLVQVVHHRVEERADGASCEFGRSESCFG
jgi:hypothetical protein